MAVEPQENRHSFKRSLPWQKSSDSFVFGKKVIRRKSPDIIQMLTCDGVAVPIAAPEICSSCFELSCHSSSCTVKLYVKVCLQSELYN